MKSLKKKKKVSVDSPTACRVVAADRFVNGDGREEEELPRLEDLEGEGADALEGEGACEDLAGEAVWRVDAEDFPRGGGAGTGASGAAYGTAAGGDATAAGTRLRKKKIIIIF